MVPSGIKRQVKMLTPPGPTKRPTTISTTPDYLLPENREETRDHQDDRHDP
jgi:hypothetical protein